MGFPSGCDLLCCAAAAFSIVAAPWNGRWWSPPTQMTALTTLRTPTMFPL